MCRRDLDNVWSISVAYTVYTFVLNYCNKVHFLLYHILHKWCSLSFNAINFPQISFWHLLTIQWCQNGMKINLHWLELYLIHHRQYIRHLHCCQVHRWELLLLWKLFLVGTFKLWQLTYKSRLLKGLVLRNNKQTRVLVKRYVEEGMLLDVWHLNVPKSVFEVVSVFTVSLNQIQCLYRQIFKWD